jgi:hypothetical protein
MRKEEEDEKCKANEKEKLNDKRKLKGEKEDQMCREKGKTKKIEECKKEK